MKKTYKGIVAIKVSLIDGFMRTEDVLNGYSGCDSIVGFHNMGLACDSPEDERAVYWTSSGPRH